MHQITGPNLVGKTRWGTGKSKLLTPITASPPDVSKLIQKNERNICYAETQRSILKEIPQRVESVISRQQDLGG